MKFFVDYNLYKKNHALVNKFINHVNAINTVSILDSLYLSIIHATRRDDSHAVIEASIDYPEEIGHIHDILQLEHGLYKNSSEIESAEHYEQMVEYEGSILNSKINYSTITLLEQKLDNYKREIKFIFNFNGELHDLDLLNDNKYYVYIAANEINQTAPYWTNLLTQALGLEKEMKYELALLVMFSAFDNYISLEIEKLEKEYFKEFNLLRLEFGKKVSVLLKHFLKVVPGSNNEEHHVKDLILKMYEELYTLRNAVAHGNTREIKKDDFHKCLDMLIFTYTAIEFSPVDNADLLKNIKLI